MAEEQPIWVNVTAFQHTRPEVLGAVMDLVAYFWAPTKSAFTFDPDGITEHLNAAMPARGYTAAGLKRDRAEIAKFFVETPDGRWAPSPEYFSLTSGNPGDSLT
jgi:hypothetical protein